MRSKVNRLSALDAAFVSLDAWGTPYVVGGILIFDRAPLARDDGGLDVARIRAYLGAAIDRLPEYRRRIGRVPLLRHPVWRDTQVDLEHHLRETHVAAPGGAGELDELVARLLSEDLDPRRPPWELHLVDGLADGSVALVAKVHHALIDGFSGVKVLEHMLRGVPDPTIPERRDHLTEHHAPLALVRDEIAHRLNGLRALPQNLPGKPRELMPALVRLLARGLRPAPDIGLNPRRVGRDRVFASVSFDLEEIKRIKRAFGVKLNDVVLAIATGAFRRFLAQRGVAVDELHDFRAMVPASTHAPGDASVSGSRVALLLVQLPIDEPDPVRRLARIHASTAKSKGGAHEAEAGELLVRLSDVTVPALLAGTLALALAQRGFHFVITNVPGPPFALYLLGARLRRFQAVVNLWPRQAVGMALMSYDGRLSWTIHADREVIPDPRPLADELERAFGELRSATGAEAASASADRSPPPAHA